MANFTSSIKLIALLSGAALGFRVDDDDIVPSVATWNCGGGAPKPEYLGGGWESVSGGFWSEAEKRVGALILNLSGTPAIKKDYDFRRYNPLKASAMLPSGITTVEELLTGLPEAAENAGYDLTRFSCYKDLSLEDLLKFVMGRKTSLPPKTLKDGRDCWGIRGFEGKSFVAHPDGCFKERAKFGRIDFIQLLGKPAAQYWQGWLQSLPSTFSVGHCDIAGKSTVNLLRNYPVIDAADFLPIAIFDRLAFLVTQDYQAASSSPTPEEPKVVGKDTVGEIIRHIAYWVAGQVDVLLLQETTSSDDAVSGYTKLASAEGKRQDTAVWVKSDLVNTAATAEAAMHISTLRTSLAQNVQDISGDFGGEAAVVANIAKGLWSKTILGVPLRGEPNKYTKAIMHFWKSDPQKVTVAVAGNTVLVSVHADSAGYTSGEALVMARMLQAMMGSDTYSVLVGIDSNVQPSAKAGALDVPALLRWADALGFNYPEPSPGLQTVDKQRGFVQAQLLKAGKTDRVFKDWLFYRPSNSQPYEQLPYQVVNNPVSPATFLNHSFPTDSFPIDHFIVFMKKDAVTAKE